MNLIKKENKVNGKIKLVLQEKKKKTLIIH